MAPSRYEISLLVLKICFLLVRCAHSWNIFEHSNRKFVSPRSHVKSSIYLAVRHLTDRRLISVCIYFFVYFYIIIIIIIIIIIVIVIVIIIIIIIIIITITKLLNLIGYHCPDFSLN